MVLILCIIWLILLNTCLPLAENTSRKPDLPGGLAATTKKPAAKKKLKWKPVECDKLSFELSLLPRRANIPLTDCDIIYDMQEELKKFKKELTQLKDNDVQDSASVTDPMMKETDDKLKEQILFHRVLFGDILTTESTGSINDLYNDFQLNNETYFEDKVPFKMLERLEKFRDNKSCKCLRRKHKWKYQKARKAIKTKYFITKNIVNKAHGRKLYINHRLRKEIDGKGFVFAKLGGRTQRQYTGACAPRNHVAPERNYPVAQPVPAYALRANNADGAFENDMVNILINLQNRDLTPEDYELLLRLDERVAPKTVTQDILDTFKTDVVTESEVNETCAVCIEAYQLGQERKHLPCGHIFHQNCIDTWLKNSSLNCPLDGLSVEQELSLSFS